VNKFGKDFVSEWGRECQ